MALQTGATEQTIAGYFAAFSTDPGPAELAEWPPDVFALANLVLDHTEAYRFAVAPSPGRRWPPTPEWNQEVAAAAEEWRHRAATGGRQAPPSVMRHWETVVAALDRPLSALRRGEDPDLCAALITLHAMADEACRGLSGLEASRAGTFERSAWELLASHGSLSRIDATRVRITPKTHLAARGITIRSLSRYLALNYEAVDVRWRRIEPLPRTSDEHREFNLLLVPWPLRVDSAAFRPMTGPVKMDPGAFGFFEFDPGRRFDVDLLSRLLDAAAVEVNRVDAVVLPEAAIEAGDVGVIEALLGRRGIGVLIAGVREQATARRLGRNFIHLGLGTRKGWEHFEQAKHHRWCLDEGQIRQYHLTRALAPSTQWWEGIDLPERTVEIIDAGGGLTTAPLVCEDLARLDEVADVLRRIGPSLVVALLLDGPQLPQRWPCRYATILADEPGSAVLTLSSFGMVSRSRPPGRSRSRAVAMWSDPTSGLHQIDLARGAAGVLLTTSVGRKTVWTADGRRHDRGTPSPALVAVHQLRVRSKKGEVRST